MITAVYARKSNDQNGADADAERRAERGKPMKKERNPRRARGSGSVYLKRRVYWISYYGPDGQRHAERSESERKGDAIRLLQRRVGARENHLPVIPRAEQLTFHEAARPSSTTSWQTGSGVSPS